MADDQNTTASAYRDRRPNQLYCRGVQNVALNANPRLTLTHHFILRGRTADQPPAAKPISLTISKYRSVPLGARRIYDAVLPPPHNRADLIADLIYFYHPSARHDLQSLLTLQPSAPSHSPVLIENSYIFGVYSTNPKTKATSMSTSILPTKTTQLTKYSTSSPLSLNPSRRPNTPPRPHA